MKNKNEQVWTDPEFKKLLEKIRAKRILAGVDCKSLTEVTRDIVNNQKIKDIIDKELAFGLKITKEKDETRLF
jgi:hypothetical protein